MKYLRYGSVIDANFDLRNLLQSNRCHIKDMTPEQLISQGEEPNEMGGYFICNGLEKLIRLLIVPRSNNVG